MTSFAILVYVTEQNNKCKYVFRVFSMHYIIVDQYLTVVYGFILCLTSGLFDFRIVALFYLRRRLPSCVLYWPILWAPTLFV